jgi:hypothetical protein
MFFRRKFNLLTVCAAGLLLGACGSAKMVDSWKDPSAGPVEFKKVAVFFLHKDRTVRGIGEEELVRQVNRTVAVPSIGMFQELDPKNVDGIVNHLKSKGFEGAILMRITKVDETVRVSSGIRPAYYLSFTTYYSYLVPGLDYYPGLPPKISKDRKVRIETVVYSLVENKLLWVGTSEMENPESIRDLITRNAPVVAGSLKQGGLLR